MKKLQLLLKSIGIAMFFFIILLLSAGRLDYYQGWLYISLSIIMNLITLFSAQSNPDLISERMNPGKGMKNWDKLILTISAVLYIIMLVVSGLDSGRFQWSPEYSWPVNLTGVILTLGGHIVFVTAKRQNRFFSSVVRIQSDRGHTVCDTGLYKVVRHPGYFGMLISTTGFPLLLGSAWSIIPAATSIILLLIRTYLEDNTLKEELEGYSEYTLKTPFRLFPGIW